jgi:hypothetical protein
MEIVRQRPLAARLALRDSCVSCKISHIHQGARRPQSAPPLSELEIEQIREVFRTCPIARRIADK